MLTLTVFTFRLDFDEDRIRLLAASEDGRQRLAFWLTRRMTDNLLRNSQHWLTQQYAAAVNVPSHAQGDLYELYHDQARESFEQQQAMTRSKPVEQVEHTELLRRLDIQKGEDDQLKLLFFSGEEVDACSLMTVDYFHQWLHVLQQKSEEMGWSLTPPAVPQGSYSLQ
ncbi:hypothetical protein [Marinobacterium arenosum]|uniref:hypothetical protein n=1 Tax=Marinobacterium arenosum TaxID=2862496 RepID=UPI001C95A448|nr:hypothetical protein [Marinobacterium arenosum]MBY4678513.1 hypothetical protein [Marinobacterium arenosum]